MKNWHLRSLKPHIAVTQKYLKLGTTNWYRWIVKWKCMVCASKFECTGSIPLQTPTFTARVPNRTPIFVFNDCHKAVFHQKLQNKAIKWGCLNTKSFSFSTDPVQNQFCSTIDKYPPLEWRKLHFFFVWYSGRFLAWSYWRQIYRFQKSWAELQGVANI